MESPRESKAQGFTSFIKVLRDRFDDKTMERVIAQLPADTRALIEHPPLPVAWIDDMHWNHLMHALVDGPLRGDVSAMAALGRAQMLRDLSGIYKMLMRLVSPQTVLAKAASIYGTYSRNGTMSARAISKQEAEVVLDDVANAIPASWHFHIGTIAGTLEMAGAKALDVRIVEGGGTGRRTVYRARWS